MSHKRARMKNILAFIWHRMYAIIKKEKYLQYKKNLKIIKKNIDYLLY